MKRKSLTPESKMPSYSLKSIVAQNIKKLRYQRGLSQEKLAAMCGYHRTYVGAVERGERNITLATLEAFANALSVDPRELLNDENTGA